MYAEFDLIMPTSLSELTAVIAGTKAPGRMLLAGGTVALVDIRSRKEQPEVVVSLDKIGELKGIRREAEAIRIGARATVSDILNSREIAASAPSLIEAAKIFAGQMVRNTATVGGNIGCGSPAADLVPPLLSLDAEVELVSRSGTRRVDLAGYFTGYRKDVRRADEIISAVLVPAQPANSVNAFYKLARRKGDAITIVGVAVSVAMSGKTCSHVRIALGSVSPFPMRARRAEALLEGRQISAALVEDAAEAAMRECSPIDDVRATASYRSKMVKVLTRRLLLQACEGSR